MLISEKGKRLQMVAGLEVAKGSLIAFSDDHIRWGPRCLVSLLACFEDQKDKDGKIEDKQIGAVAPTVDAYLPASRQNLKTITPWEIAAMKFIPRGPDGGWITALYAASKWCFVIGGAAGVYRADILRNKEFIKAFEADIWGGN